MSASTDYLIDRRRMRRRLGWWRAAALVALALAGLGFFVRVEGADYTDKLTPHIARLSIQGLITGDRDTIDMIQKISESDNVRALLLSLDSPGGTTAGSEKLYDELRRLGEKKPIVSVVNNVAASGAYIAALATDRIVARNASLVGSIGVLVQYPKFYKLLDTVGVKFEEVKSSPLKAAPNTFEPTSEEARAAVASVVADTYDWFKIMVKERRKLNDTELAKVSDGRVFTAHQGLPLKLVDEIGGEREAIAWLETEKKIQKSLPVRDWKRKTSIERLGLVHSAAGLARAAGFDALAIGLESVVRAEQVAGLDGLLAIWQGFP